MKRSRLLILAVLGTGVLGLSWGSTWSPADKASPPSKVLESVGRAYPNATIGKAFAGRMSLRVYEVVVHDAGKVLDLLVAEDGTLVAAEQQVTRDQLPPAVARTLDQAAGTADVREIERTERYGRYEFVPLARPEVFFEAEWHNNGVETEVGIAESGALLGGDDEGEDGDDGEDEDDEGEEEDDDGDGDDQDDDDKDEGGGGGGAR